MIFQARKFGGGEMGSMYVLSYEVRSYIDGCRSVDRMNCSLVTPVNKQRQSDSY